MTNLWKQSLSVLKQQNELPHRSPESLGKLLLERKLKMVAVGHIEKNLIDLKYFLRDLSVGNPFLKLFFVIGCFPVSPRILYFTEIETKILNTLLILIVETQSLYYMRWYGYSPF